jgi:hypothetical protein
MLTKPTLSDVPNNITFPLKQCPNFVLFKYVGFKMPQKKIVDKIGENSRNLVTLLKIGENWRKLAKIRAIWSPC